MSEKPKNTFIPNSYQKPNAFVDELMRLLPPACNLILDVACRQILGWEEHRASRRDRISLSQFEDLSGLSVNTIRTHLEILHAANILVPDGRPNLQGQEYELNLGQLGEYRVDYLRALPRRRGDISPALQSLKARRLQVELPITGGTGVSNFDTPQPYQNLIPSNDCKGGVSTIAREGYQSVQTPNSKLKNIPLESLWLKVLGLVRAEIPPATFETWLSGAELVGVQDNLFQVATPHRYAADWLNDRLARTFSRHASEVTGQPAQVEFVAQEKTHV